VSESRGNEHAELMLAEARVHLAHNRVAEAAETLERAIALLESRRHGQGDDAIGSLTPAEARVSRMAASGMKNREIAEALAVSIKAIEYHLANTYRKLGIRGRTELTRMFNFAAPVLALLGAGV
jgi:DNA-binding NarL/FixJ family response regulator